MPREFLVNPQISYPALLADRCRRNTCLSSCRRCLSWWVQRHTVSPFRSWTRRNDCGFSGLRSCLSWTHWDCIWFRKHWLSCRLVLTAGRFVHPLFCCATSNTLFWVVQINRAELILFCAVQPDLCPITGGIVIFLLYFARLSIDIGRNRCIFALFRPTCSRYCLFFCPGCSIVYM